MVRIGVLHKSQKKTLGIIRDLKTVFVLEWGDSLLVKNEAENGWSFIQKVPFEKSVYINEGYIFNWGERVPFEKFELSKWILLYEYFSIKLPVSALKGELKDQIEVSFVPGDTPKGCLVLVTNFFHWKDYCLSNSKLRTYNLEYSLSDDSRVIVLGEPIPNIPGVEYLKEGNLLWPSGLAFEFSFLKQMLLDKTREADSYFLFYKEGNYEEIKKENLGKMDLTALRKALVI